jgi:hypothetical protein
MKARARFKHTRAPFKRTRAPRNHARDADLYTRIARRVSPTHAEKWCLNHMTLAIESDTQAHACQDYP